MTRLGIEPRSHGPLANTLNNSDNFNKTNKRKKWYMHNPESVLENETHKPPWGFEKQTDHLISARQPD